MKNICHIIILFLFNFVVFDFITNHINITIKEIAIIYGLGILFGIISIASYIILDKLFRGVQ